MDTIRRWMSARSTRLELSPPDTKRAPDDQRTSAALAGGPARPAPDSAQGPRVRDRRCDVVLAPPEAMSKRQAGIVLMAGRLSSQLPVAIGDRTKEKSLGKIDDVARHFPVAPADDAQWPRDFAVGFVRHSLSTLQEGRSYNCALVGLLSVPVWQPGIAYPELAQCLMAEGEQLRSDKPQALARALARDFLEVASLRAPEAQRVALAQLAEQLRSR